MRLQRPSATTAPRLVAAVFVAGLALSVLLLARSQSAGDQLNLLARGWLWAAKGHFIPYGNPMSTGGKAPGAITTVLVGLPLFVWRDHRAPTVVILLFHILGFLLLDRTLRPVLQPHERVLLAVLYWLNPWRLYFSAFPWNPNYLFLFGAVHLWSCLGQRERPRFLLSFVQAAGMLLALQIHASFLLLAVASALLWRRRYFKVHWPGAVAGAIVGALPLVPWYLAVRADPSLVTAASKGFLGRGLLYVFPLLRGSVYWLRYSSLYITDRISAFDFTDLLGADPWLGRILMAGVRVLLPLTLLFPLLANRWLWLRTRRALRKDRKPLAADATDRAWLKGYVVWSFAAAVIVFALSPTTIMYWQGVTVFHAAVLPLVLWAGALWRTRRADLVSKSVPAWIAVSLLLTVAMALGSPQFRCRGRHAMTFPLAHHSPMFDDLGIQQTCPWPLDRPGGWWPDVLPAEPGSGRRAARPH
jgi:hypothetical protein